MSRIALALAWLVLAPPLARADTATMLNAEVWYLQFESTLTGAGREEGKTNEGAITVTSASYEQFTTGRIKFDMRTPGLSLSMLSLAKLPPAEQQKAQMDMIMRTDQCATWMPADPMVLMEPSGTSRAKSHHEWDAKNPTSPIDSDRVLIVTDGSGEANVSFVSQPMFEIDTTKNEYRIMFPYAGGDNAGDSMKYKTTTTTWDEGAQSETKVEETTQSLAMPQLTFTGTDPAAGLLGKFDPAAGKVSGSHTFDVKVKDQMEISGKLVIKYTLTTTPPAEPAAGK
jgi:hypothetical protein